MACLILQNATGTSFLSLRRAQASAPPDGPPYASREGAGAAALELFAQSQTAAHLLKLEFRDAGSGGPLAVRVGIFDEGKNPLPPPDLEAHMYQSLGRDSYFYCEDSVGVWVDSGDITVKAGCGFEYEPIESTLTVLSDTTVVLALNRFARMDTLGWYSADTHVHLSHPPLVYDLDSSHLRLIARAEDLNFINSMEESDYFTGALDSLSEPNRLLYFSKEQRNSDFAHLTIIGLRQWISDTGCSPSPPFCGATLDAAIYEQVHSQGSGVAVIATHPFPTLDITDISAWPGGGVWRAMPIDLAAGAVDAMDLLCYSHVKPLPGVSHYITALNAGFRLPPSAGTDAIVGTGLSYPPGGYRVYVMPPDGTPFTLDSWVDGFLAGRSFVTNYPLVTRFELNGALPGDIVHHSGETLTGSVAVTCIEPIDAVVVIGNGEVLRVFAPGEGSGRQLSADFSIEPGGLDWIAAIVMGEESSWHAQSANGLYAHTGAIYLESGPSGLTRDELSIETVSPSSQTCRGAANFFLDMLARVDSLFTDSGNFPGDSRTAFDGAVADAYHHFNALCNDPPDPFALLYPRSTADGPRVIADPTPRFIWESARDPDPGDSVAGYAFVIDTRRDFTTAAVISGLTDTSFVFPEDHPLEPGVTYYWLVAAVDQHELYRLSTPLRDSLVVDTTATAVGHGRSRQRWYLDMPRPNPFNPSVRIEYTVPAGGVEHRLDIFDATGRRVRALFAGRRSGGTYSDIWDGTNDAGGRVASGVYFVRLAPQGARSITRKVILLK